MGRHFISFAAVGLVFLGHLPVVRFTFNRFLMCKWPQMLHYVVLLCCEVATMAALKTGGYVNRYWFCIVSLLVVLSNSVFAQNAKLDLYRSVVPVRSQDASERQFAAQKGLQEVLVRMSGSASVLESPSVQEAIGKAQRYLEQFQYARLDNSELKQKGFEENLSLVFSARVVKEILREAKQPFWPETRPKTLVWLVENHIDDGKRFLGADSSHPLIQSLNASAKLRGAPLIYPLLDLDDQIALSPEQVWNLNEAAIYEASARYHADVILLGRFSETSQGVMLATWQIAHRGESRVFDSRSDDIAALGLDVVAPLTEWMSSIYGIVPQAQGEQKMYLNVAGIQSFGQYMAAFNYLQGLAMAKDVQLVAARQDTLLLALAADTDIEKLVSTLKLDGRLRENVRNSGTLAPVELPWGQGPQRGSAELPLEYRWFGS